MARDQTKAGRQGRMLNSQLHKVDLNDLMGLISNGVPEGAQLEYKEALPGNDDESKKEFLRDVSAMANTAGGDIIYGVREERPGDDAPAAEIVAITGEDIDSRKLWMENLIRDGIEPRLTGVGIHVVPADGAGSVFIVRVPRSWNGPHVVNFRKHWRLLRPQLRRELPDERLSGPRSLRAQGIARR